MRTEKIVWRVPVEGYRSGHMAISENGRYCFVSVSGEDRVSVISFNKRKEVASIPVGNHPQRMRTGHVRRAFVR